MSVPSAKLCHGTVVHRRYRPKVHGLRYRVFSLLVDLDELGALSDRLKLFSFNRRNLFSLHEKDHGTGVPGGLKRTILEKVNARYAEMEIERVVMLCFPRVLGYVFNPLTVYYCYGPGDALKALVYEVNNTFGDRHHYVLSVDGAQEGTLAQACSKKMYVSPFNAVDGSYEFHVSAPGENVAVGVNLRVDGAPVLKAYLAAKTAELSDRALMAAFVRLPAMTFKVIAAIHWEAFLLWAKGLKIKKRPRALQSFSLKNKSTS
ncbi:MAG: DUF1365 domain-containing protein [Pseudomonadota bacterium]